MEIKSRLLVKASDHKMMSDGHKDAGSNNLRYEPGMVINVYRPGRNPYGSVEMLRQSGNVLIDSDMTMAEAQMFCESYRDDTTDPDFRKRELKVDLAVLQTRVEAGRTTSIEIAKEALRTARKDATVKRNG